jgi:hypothetical protein
MFLFSFALAKAIPDFVARWEDLPSFIMGWTGVTTPRRADRP